MTSPSASGSPRPSLHPFNRSNYPQHFMGPNAPIPTSARLHQYSLLSPAGLLKRHAVSVDESGPYRYVTINLFEITNLQNMNH